MLEWFTEPIVTWKGMLLGVGAFIVILAVVIGGGYALLHAVFGNMRM